jgi:hypothetical protein
MPPWTEAGQGASFQWLLARELLLLSELVGPKFGRARRRINFSAATGIVQRFLSLFFVSQKMA